MLYYLSKFLIASKDSDNDLLYKPNPSDDTEAEENK